MEDLCGPWAGWEDVVAIGVYSSLAEVDVAPLLMPATQILWRMSGRKYSGVCAYTGLRPCKRYSGPPVPGLLHWGSDFGNVAVRQAQFWWGRDCGCGWNECSCWVDYLDFGDLSPVQSVDQVTIDGVVIDPAEYQLFDHGFLVRMGGKVWPTQQRLDLPTTAVGTWSVDLHAGPVPPEDAVMAAAVLAAELAMALGPGTAGECRLPERVQSVTRQGVSYLVADPQQFFGEGRTGLYFPDLFLASANPEGRHRRAVLGYVGMDRGPSHRS